MAAGPWTADAGRELSRDFDLWDLAEAVVDFTESVYRGKGYRPTLSDVSLDAVEGQPPMKSVASARELSKVERLTPRTLWFFMHGDQSDGIAWRRRVSIHVRVDFPATLRHFEGVSIYVSGADRDEVTGLGHRFQEWLNTLTPEILGKPTPVVPAASPAVARSGAKKFWIGVATVLAVLGSIATIVGVILDRIPT